MIPKLVDELTSSDLEALVVDGVAESRSLDYKEALPGPTDADKKEFLADVGALANSGGGDLVYGVTEERDEAGRPSGVPQAVKGLADIGNLDALQLALEQSIRAGIEPRVGFSLKGVAGFPAGPALVLRVHPSWAGPHMVTFKGTSRFYARGGTGKYQMDIQQIRAAFLLSSGVEGEIRRFRDDRLSFIKSGEVHAAFPEGPKLVLHSVPVQAVSQGQRPLLDADQLRGVSSEITPRLHSSLSYGPNLEGWRIWSVPVLSSTVQMFRTGALEFVCAAIRSEDDKDWGFHAREVGEQVASMATGFLRTHGRLGLNPPCLLLLSMLGTRGCFFVDREQHSPFPRGLHKQGVFDREIGALPDVLVEDFSVNVSELVGPILDIVSQAAGFDRSPLSLQGDSAD